MNSTNNTSYNGIKEITPVAYRKDKKIFEYKGIEFNRNEGLLLVNAIMYFLGVEDITEVNKLLPQNVLNEILNEF